MHKYVVAYGLAEIIEQNYEELLHPIVKKYAPADKIEQIVQMIMERSKPCARSVIYRENSD
jgi:hypothetical protein